MVINDLADLLAILVCKSFIANILLWEIIMKKAELN